MDLQKIYETIKKELDENNSKIAATKKIIQDNEKNLDEYEKMEYFIKGKLKMLVTMSDLLEDYLKQDKKNISCNKKKKKHKK